MTEYTTDIAKAFKKVFKDGGGKLVYDQEFLPKTNDFRSNAALILQKKPQAILCPPKQELHLGLFIKQLRGLEGSRKPIEVHTTMVAAPNPDAHLVAGQSILGVYFMDPNYDKDGNLYHNFNKLYLKEYKIPPAAPFHVAAVIESLDLIQQFLDRYKTYDAEHFKTYLLQEVGKKCGYIGCYSVDEFGNTNNGFHIAKITKLINKK